MNNASTFPNATWVQNPPSHTPFYYTERPSLFRSVPDTAVAVAAPVVAYWSLSLVFHAFDVSEWRWLDKYRIHDSAEVQSRNRVTRARVVWMVLLQQAIQTALGVYWMAEDESRIASPRRDMEKLSSAILHASTSVLGHDVSYPLLEAWGTQAVHFLYWWGIPVAQFLFAMFIIDTWQYFLHRFMHVNKFCYKHFHSVHHRLYVPYAFGALYNHPLEGFLLDSLGAALAEWMSGMTIRQAILLFSFSTFKTVDDHCGYKLPFDPLQLVTSNNADYHDIHHQVIGIKSNFSQPFFIHWDALLNTRMTRKDIEERRRKIHNKSI